jgi:PTH1 family peptidyl-tRNA hydrolase
MNYLIVGLGNPGIEYEKTRHNAGWIVIDMAFPQLEFGRDPYANAGTATEGNLLFVKPATFMNLSGETVQYFVYKKEYLPENIIVIYDDIDLPLGKFKISFDRGSGGHNGIKSIETCLGSREFIRIRIGISKTLESGELVKPNVLGKFEPAELEQLGEVSKKVKTVIETILKEGKEKAMTKFNSNI